MKVFRLNGTYVTLAEYARAEGITNRGAKARLKSPNRQLFHFKMGNQIFIKLS